MMRTYDQVRNDCVFVMKLFCSRYNVLYRRKEEKRGIVMYCGTYHSNINHLCPLQQSPLHRVGLT